MPRKQQLLVFLFLFAVYAVFGQSASRGAIFDGEAYSSLPRKAVLATRAYEELPKSFSLKQYAPLPGDQADYGTCVAWASAYAARTISESVALDRRNQTETTQNVFSPVFVYRKIRPDDPECMQGAQIYSALDMMRDSGAVRMSDIERSVDFPKMDISYYDKSRKYPIADYVTLFTDEDKQKPALVIRMVKKSLSEGKPVIIGMNTPDSFIDAKNIWEPNENPGRYYGGHALCVVGYDDSRFGGSFELLNSWGRKWGNAGYIWIPYKTFVDFVIEAYEIIENLAVYSDKVKFDGFTRIELSGSAQAELVLDQEGFYRTAISRGEQFRYVIGAGESSYVYSFAVSQSADGQFDRPVLMFPQSGVSPLLNYRDSTLILPGEDKDLAPGEKTVTEYLITLYSKQALDISDIIRRFDSTKGPVTDRLEKALGTLCLADLSFNENETAFTAEPDDFRSVAALIAAIDIVK